MNNWPMWLALTVGFVTMLLVGVYKDRARGERDKIIGIECVKSGGEWVRSTWDLEHNCVRTKK